MWACGVLELSWEFENNWLIWWIIWGEAGCLNIGDWEIWLGCDKIGIGDDIVGDDWEFTCIVELSMFVVLSEWLLLWMG